MSHSHHQPNTLPFKFNMKNASFSNPKNEQFCQCQPYNPWVHSSMIWRIPATENNLAAIWTYVVRLVSKYLVWSIPPTENNLDIRCQVGLDYGYWINDPHTLPGWSAAKRTSCSWLGGIKRVLIDQLRAKTVGAHRWEKLCTGKVLSSAIHPHGLFHEITVWCLLFAGLLHIHVHI